jgi:putative SOS response-associated peptidase YedK
MCGRYANPFENVQAWKDHFGEKPEKWSSEATMGYNTAPTQMIPVITGAGILVARWGMIPSWAKEVSTKFATFNARIETVAEKPTYRGAWSHNQRCLVPALGYYEWKTEHKMKQPYFIRPIDSSPLVFGGLYEPSRGEDIPASCTILTMPATEHMTDLHNRMPVMFQGEAAQEWLSASTNDAKSMLLGNRTMDFQVYQVDRSVNNVRTQGSALIEPVGT